MPTFIKTGYWESAVKSYKGWLNLEDIVSNSLPPQAGNAGKFLRTDGSTLSWVAILNPNIYTENGTLTGNRTVTMGAFTLSFEKDIIVNGHRIGRGNGNVSTSIAIGQLAATSTTTASQSVFIGYSAGNLVTTANANVLIGAYAGRVIDTGGANTIIGQVSGYTLTSGTYNTLIGRQSGNGLTTGIHNVVVTVIGSQVSGLTPTLSNNIIIADGQGNQRLVFNSSGQGVVGSSAYPTFVSGIQFDIVGKARATSLNLSALPTSSAGLSSGDLWNNAGVVNIVP